MPRQASTLTTTEAARSRTGLELIQNNTHCLASEQRKHCLCKLLKAPCQSFTANDNTPNSFTYVIRGDSESDRW